MASWVRRVRLAWGVTVVVGSRPAIGGAIRNSPAVAVWIGGFVSLVTGSFAGGPGIVITGFYILVSLPVISRASILPIGLAANGVTALCLIDRNIEPLLRGLSFGVGLGAFLTSVLMIRSTLIQTMSVARAEARFSALPSIDRTGVGLLIAFTVGCVFHVGSWTLLSPLLEGCPKQERNRLAPAMLCGMCLSLLWSPFSIGMIFVAKILPGVPIKGGIELGAGFSVVVLLAALTIYRRFRFSVVRGAVSVLAPTLAPISALLASVTATCWAANARVTEAIVLVSPAFCVIYLLVRDRSAIRPTLRTTFARSGGTLSDLPLYVPVSHLPSPSTGADGYRP